MLLAEFAAVKILDVSAAQYHGSKLQKLPIPILRLHCRAFHGYGMLC